ncbi:dynamin family protein [Ruminococcus albus]|jgi:GTPase SAR1 family protein|uniref:Dynamin n=1 Tax=Ruminococcus albus SY3 TaxID=1341156 RepID=A0A011V245_RUMAL|nr:dynamin family protein [Ruminococcus albus]EXM39502.1 dynamin [Ruminococcus albus SY3]MBP5269055.1 dynamin family protein [Ruminococcus sp.]
MEKQINYGSYAGYKETVGNLTADLQELLKLSEEIALVNTAESIKETLEKAKDEHFEVAIVGEFKRGKSTLINALLGQEVLPADVLPATATLNRVTYSTEPYVQVEYKNGDSERVEIDRLEEYVTKLTSESERKAETVKEATVYYDTEFCRNNVDIIDTPGLNDDDQMTNVTMSIIPKIDAAVFVISANSPFSQFEKEFLEKKMLTSDVGRIIFVVNCFGTFTQDDENKIVETVRTRIGKYVMEKAKKVMGEDSREFAVYKRKIGTPRVIGVYAKRALTAKTNGDKELLEQSNFPEFEKALETLLTQERGVITLQILANKITNSGTEILRSIVMQENALMMANDEFMEKYDAAIKEIDEIRNLKRSEFVKINDAANKVFEDLRPVLDNYWSNIEEAAMEVIDNFQMSSDDFKKDRLKLVSSKLTEKIKESMEARAQIICEQIQNSINQAVSGETERLQEFEDEFFESVAAIQRMFAVSDRVSSNGGTLDKVIGAATGAYGVGGIYLGFRESGVKGALLGGATGLAGFYATYYAAMFFAGFFGLTGGLPITLVMMAFAGIAGTFTSNFAVDKILVQERIDKYKTNFKANVKKQFHEMMLNNDFTETVRRQVFSSFDSIKSKIEEETEIILRDTQETLDNLNDLKAEKSEVSQKEMERLHVIAETASELVQDAYAVRKVLNDEISINNPQSEKSEKTQQTEKPEKPEESENTEKK